MGKQAPWRVLLQGMEFEGSCSLLAHNQGHASRRKGDSMNIVESIKTDSSGREQVLRVIERRISRGDSKRQSRIYTVAINNCINGNYETKEDALAHYKRLLVSFRGSGAERNGMEL